MGNRRIKQKKAPGSEQFWGEHICRNNAKAPRRLLWKHASEDWSMSYHCFLFFFNHVPLGQWQCELTVKLSF